MEVVGHLGVSENEDWVDAVFDFVVDQLHTADGAAAWLENMKGTIKEEAGKKKEELAWRVKASKQAKRAKEAMEAEVEAMEAKLKAKKEAIQAEVEAMEAKVKAMEEAMEAKKEAMVEVIAAMSQYLQGTVVAADPDWVFAASELHDWVATVLAGLEQGGPVRQVRQEARTPKHSKKKDGAIPRSHQKDSASSHSSQSAKTQLHGFQRTERHAMAWAEWQLDSEEMADAGCDLDAMYNALLAVCPDASAYHDLWLEMARLVYATSNFNELTHIHPLFEAWAESVLVYVFRLEDGGEGDGDGRAGSGVDGREEGEGGEDEGAVDGWRQHCSPILAHEYGAKRVDVPVYTATAFEHLVNVLELEARVPKAALDDAKTKKHAARSGKADFAVLDGEEQLKCFVELKIPVDLDDEKLKNRSKGQLIAEAAGMQEFVAEGQAVVGFMTDMRYRTTLVYMMPPASPVPWVRAGEDVNEVSRRALWAFALSNARPRPETRADDDTDVFCVDRASFAAKAALVGMGLGILGQSFNPGGVREALADKINRKMDELHAQVSGYDAGSSGGRRRGRQGGGGCGGGGREREQKDERGRGGRRRRNGRGRGRGRGHRRGRGRGGVQKGGGAGSSGGNGRQKRALATLSSSALNAALDASHRTGKKLVWNRFLLAAVTDEPESAIDRATRWARTGSVL